MQWRDRAEFAEPEREDLGKTARSVGVGRRDALAAYPYAIIERDEP
jgi:hypothetical protein